MGMLGEMSILFLLIRSIFSNKNNCMQVCSGGGGGSGHGFGGGGGGFAPPQPVAPPAPVCNCSMGGGGFGGFGGGGGFGGYAPPPMVPMVPPPMYVTPPPAPPVQPPAPPTPPPSPPRVITSVKTPDEPITKCSSRMVVDCETMTPPDQTFSITVPGE